MTDPLPSSLGPTPLTRWRGARRATMLAVVVALLTLGLPLPAFAWWGWLEKLSGPPDLNGPQFEVRVVCFGEKPPEVALAESLAADATALMVAARGTDDQSKEWQIAGEKWREVTNAWAAALDEAPPSGGTGNNRERAFDWRARAWRLEGRERAKLMATSSAGVMWSLCRPDRERRLALDVNWGLWGNDGTADYAGGAPIRLSTLMTSVSWRLLADTDWDFVDLSAGGGVYWFTSEGFPSQQGVVLQPARITVRAPSSWSGKPLGDWRRWAAIPVYGIGLTVFPAGFEATDFAGVEGKAVRIPRELLTTQYFFVNVEPFLRMVRK